MHIDLHIDQWDDSHTKRKGGGTEPLSSQGSQHWGNSKCLQHGCLFSLYQTSAYTDPCSKALLDLPQNPFTQMIGIHTN